MKPIQNICKSLALLFIVFAFTKVNAQLSSIDFLITSNSLYTAGATVPTVSVIQKTGDTLVWTQNTNATPVVMEFAITEAAENWDQTTSLGTISYQMDIDGYQSIFNLNGDSTGVTATITVTLSGTETETYIFQVESITY